MALSPEHLRPSAALELSSPESTVSGEAPTHPPDLSASIPVDSSAEPTPGASEAPGLSVGTLLANRYRLLKVLGRGATGMVYEALDEGPLHRRVAVKVLHASTLSPLHDSLEAPDAPSPALRLLEAAQRRFLQEIQVAGELHHPHIVTVYDAGLWQGQLYMVQALMTGRDLSQVLRDGPLPLERALLLASQLSDAVNAVHRLQIVHLDIKPGNILLDQDDNLKLGDFGLARMLRNGVVYPDAPGVGTPGYMSPEQLLGQPLDVRTDVFSLGCVLYLLLTGRPAFPGRTKEAVSALTLASSFPPPSVLHPELPPALDRVLLRALAPEPDKRYASAAQLAQELLHHGMYSQLLSPSQAQKLLAPHRASGAVTLVLGNAMPCTPVETEPPLPLSLTHWLTQGLHAETPDLALESDTLHRPPDLPALMRLTQQQSLTLGRESVRANLLELLGNVAPELWLRAVVQLRPRLILTTRQDDGLAQALTAAGLKVCRAQLAHPLPELEPGTILIVQLLGSITEPESLLIEEDELWSQLRVLETPGNPLVEEIRSRLASTLLLYVGLEDAPSWQRRLADLLALDRMGSPPHGILCQTHISLETLHWSTRRGLAALEQEPLSWLESAAQQPGPMAPVESTQPLPSRPYKRLDHFSPEDEPIFYGRERELVRLSSLLLARPTTVLFGPSGSGKSSLIHAGLVPRLQRSGVDVLVLRPLAPPEEELRQMLQPYRESLDDGELTHAPLSELLARLARQTRLLVVILDQAEELFVRHPSETRLALAELVSRALSASQGRLRWLWSLREDFLPRLAELQSQLPALFHNTFLLQPLSASQARLAITAPARKLGLEVEDALTDQLLTELCTERVEPPQLQLVCDTLYEALDTGMIAPTVHRMTLRQLNQLGGVAGILGGYLERMIQDFPSRERQDVKQVLLALVSPEGTRAASRLEEIGLRTRITPTRTQELLEKLVQRRLLRLISREEGDWFELTHEYLTREILAWQDEAFRELRRLRQLLETGTRNHRLHGLFLPADQLALVSRALERLNPSDEERMLVQQSALALRRTRVQRAAWTLLVLLTLSILGLGGRYLMLSHSQFMRLEEQSLEGVRWDEHETQPVQTLRLYQGIPHPTALDEALGFPKPLEAQSLPTSDLTSQGQTVLPDGIALASMADLPAALAAYQAPDIAVRELILSEHWTEAVAESLRLLHSERLSPDAALRLLPLLAVSGPPTQALVEAALDHAERTELSRGLVVGTASSQREPILEPYALLLNLSPRPWWQDRLHAWVQRRETRMLGLGLLAKVGDDQDADAVRPWLTDRVFASEAFHALYKMNACSAVPELLKPPVPQYCLDAPNSCLELLTSCENPARRPEVEAFLARLVRDPNGKLSVDYLPSLFRVLRVHGHEALGTVARRWISLGLKAQELPAALGRMASLTDESALIFQHQMMQETPGNARFSAALRLARQGEATALPYLWQELPLHTDKSSFAALWAMGQFAGPTLYERLLKLTERTSTGQDFSHPLMRSPHARAGLLYALLPYDTPEVRGYLISSLSDPDLAVSADAATCLLRFVERHDTRGNPSASRARPGVREELQALSASAEPLLRLRLLRILQTLEQRANPQVFRQALEQTPGTLPLYYGAMGGLREALTLSSFDTVLQTMDSSNASVRRAAILAAGLPPHAQQLSATSRPAGMAKKAADDQKRRWDSLKRARWLASVLDKQKSYLPMLERWIHAGQTQLAKRWLERQQLSSGAWGQVLQQVLDITVEDAEVFGLRSRQTESELILRRGELDWAVSHLYFGLAEQPLEVRKQSLEARPLPELQAYVRYRQVMGLEPPLPIPPELNWNTL